MLCLTMSPGKKLHFNDDIQLKVIKVKGNQVTFGLTKPTSVKVACATPQRPIIKQK